MYVDGHVDTSSYQYHGTSLGYNYTPDGAGANTLGTGRIGRDAPPPAMMADDRPGLTAMVKGVAQRTASLPDVCSGGAFVYAGVQGPVKGKHGFAGYLGNYDSEGGWSNSGLLEGSGHTAGVAGAYSPSGGAEGLAFVPFAEAGGGLVGISKEGMLAVGGYVGTPEEGAKGNPLPVGVGAGAYFNISTMAHCAHR